SVPQRFLWLLLVIFLFKGVLLALMFPPYSGHDEVMHYAYLHTLATERQVPVIPDLEEWREQRTGGVQPNFDHAPEALFKYAQKNREPKMSFTTQDWYGDSTTPIWAVTFLGEYYPS